MRFSFKHKYADSHPDNFPIPYLSYYVRQEMPELLKKTLKRGGYGANEFAASLIPVVNRVHRYFEKDEHENLTDPMHKAIAVEDLQLAIDGIDRVARRNFSTLRMLMNGMTSVKFGKKGIYYERRDLTNPSDFLKQCLDHFKDNGQKAAEINFDQKVCVLT